MVIKDLLYDVIETLKKSGNDNAVFEAHLILRTILLLSPIDLVLNKNDEVSPEKIAEINAIVKRRTTGEPLQYILGTQEFMGLEFLVNPSVLIPRSDTEILVEHILEHFKGKPLTALDLCTGSGCIAISIASFNKNALVKGIDISNDAIITAEKNAQKLQVSNRVSFEVCDIFSLKAFGKYDLIVSNPPYIESSVIATLSDTVNKFEPHSALDGGDDGLIFYRHIIDIAPKYLASGGMLAFEIGYNQKEAVTKLMKKSFYDIKAIKDYGNNDRVISGILR